MTLDKDDDILKRLQYMFSQNVIYKDQVFNINRDGIIHYAVYHLKAQAVDYLIGDQEHNRELKNHFGDGPLDILLFRREYLQKKRRAAQGNQKKQEEWDLMLRLSDYVELMLTETSKERKARKKIEAKYEKQGNDWEGKPKKKKKK